MSSNPLLPSDPNSSSLINRTKSKKITIICLMITTCITLATSLTFAFLFFSATPQSQSEESTARPLTKLKNPVVILISSDGFRFGYQFKAPTPNIHRLINNGTEAQLGLIPVFPTLTFPNHYSIVTGLYPPYHGIINNRFTDPITGEIFRKTSKEPKWWLGEPLWETVAKAGKKAAAYFWAGCEVKKGSWHCPKKYCPPYNSSVPFEERVDTILGYFDLPENEIPVFMALYFSDPDSQGHKFGPDDPEITNAVVRIDQMIGRLITGLEKRGVFEDVSLILVGDHGMVGNCDKKLIILDDLAPHVVIPDNWVQSYTPLLAIRPPPDHSPSEIVTRMNTALNQSVENGKKLRVFLKEDLPSRLHYGASDRVAPIIGILDEGYTIKPNKKGDDKVCGGSHGYDNAFFSMRSIFIAHGPQFGRGRKVASFENVEIYNLVTRVLGIQGSPNNGTSSFPEHVLLPDT